MPEFPNKATMWKKGQSGNPNGRRGSIKDLLDKILDEPVLDEDAKTRRERLLKKLVKMAEDGHLKAAREILDRIEGTPVKRQEIQVDGAAIKLYGVNGDDGKEIIDSV